MSLFVLYVPYVLLMARHCSSELKVDAITDRTILIQVAAVKQSHRSNERVRVRTLYKTIVFFYRYAENLYFIIAALSAKILLSLYLVPASS